MYNLVVMNEMVCVKTYNSHLEANVDKTYLQSLGIEAAIQADDAGGVYPFPFHNSPTGVLLLVNKNDLEKAKEELNKVQK
jgi:hypothetical protein